jgi:hypothetical protein
MEVIMKRRLLSLLIAMIIVTGLTSAGSRDVLAADGEYAWVLVDTYQFPVSEYFRAGSFWVYSGSSEVNTAQVRITTKDTNPLDFHAKYTWTTPPNVINAKQSVTIRLEQDVISYKPGKYALSFSPFFKADSADLKLGYATAGARSFKGTYPDGTFTKDMKLAPGYMSTNAGLVGNGDAQFQKSTWVDLTVEFYDSSTVGVKRALYVGCYAGGPGSLGTRYTYEWKKLKNNVSETSSTVSAPTEGNAAEVFESGSRIMWQPASGLGYRLFRSTSQNSLGISVTDFYITSTSYADVNVEPNTTYYQGFQRHN